MIGIGKVSLGKRGGNARAGCGRIRRGESGFIEDDSGGMIRLGNERGLAGQKKYEGKCEGYRFAHGGLIPTDFERWKQCSVEQGRTNVKLEKRFCSVSIRSGEEEKCVKARSGDAMMARSLDSHSVLKGGYCTHGNRGPQYFYDYG